MISKERKKLRMDIYKSMIGYIEEMYPNGATNEQVLLELPNLWKRLEKENLLREGMSYASFVEIAYRELEKVNIFEQLRRRFGFGR